MEEGIHPEAILVGIEEVVHVSEIWITEVIADEVSLIENWTNLQIATNGAKCIRCYSMANNGVMSYCECFGATCPARCVITDAITKPSNNPRLINWREALHAIAEMFSDSSCILLKGIDGVAIYPSTFIF